MLNWPRKSDRDKLKKLAEDKEESLGLLMHQLKNHLVGRRKELVVHASLPTQDMLVQADAVALNQVLDNLVSNAVKFSPLGKQISVIVRPTATHVECQVQDEGSGFTADDKKRMFRRYGRLSARPTGGESSAGLGLSIVKKLMEAMCGELACESDPGNGARFSIRFPRASA